MTSLRSLLTGRAPAGIYRFGDDGVDVVRRVAEAAGWRVVELDTADIETRNGVYAVVQEAFGFPEWFGYNLDALADALTDVNDVPGTLLVWTGSSAFAAAEPDHCRRVLAVLRDRALDGDTPGRFLTLLQ